MHRRGKAPVAIVVLALLLLGGAAHASHIPGIFSPPVSTPATGIPVPSSSSPSRGLLRLRERTCARILRRFGENEEARRRVEERLRQRMGRACSHEIPVVPEGSLSPGEERTERTGLTIAPGAFLPSGDVVPVGASRLPVLRADFRASCGGDVTVESLTLADRGPGLARDIVGIWAESGGERITRSRILSNNKFVTLAFRPMLQVPRCTGVTVDFFAALSIHALSGSRHTFSLEMPEDVLADVPVEGEFPLRGGMFTLSGQRTGTIHVTYLPVPRDAEGHGTARQVLGKFLVAADSTEDQTLHAVTLENAGSSHDGDVSALFVRSAFVRAPFTEVAERTRDDRVTLRFDPPFPVRKNESVELEVIGDVVWNTGSTIEMRLAEPFDLYGVGSFFGYGRSGQLYGSNVMLEGNPASVRLR